MKMAFCDSCMKYHEEGNCPEDIIYSKGTDRYIQSGPCEICGGINYPLSFGGPDICPSCDCGNFGIEVVRKQGKEIKELRERLEYYENGGKD
jgi:hypothetical protein